MYKTFTLQDPGFLGGFGSAAFDPDAQAFLTATGITDSTIQDAINTLVIELKNAGIWSRIDAAYPFVGGTQTTCKFNLKNPQDTNAAFRLDFNGSWTIDATGDAPTTANSANYADTFWDTSVGGGRNDIHHVYRYAIMPDTAGCEYFGIGPAPYLIMGQCGTVEFFSGAAIASNLGSGLSGRSQGINRKNSTLVEFSRKFTGDPWTLVSSRTEAVGTISGNTLYIGAISGTIGFAEDAKNQFISIGQDLTTQQMEDLDTIATTFNTALGRNF
jgi:hypothetical protein